MENVPSSPRQFSLLAVALEGALGGVALVLGWLLGTNPLELMQPSWNAAGWGTVWGVGLAVVLLGASEFKWSALADLRRLVERLLLPLFRGCRWWDVAIISAAAGLAEELFFRGVVQAQSAQWFGSAGAIAAASVLFGLAHSVSVAYFVVATLLGVVFGWLLVAYESLLVPIVTHAVYDFVAIMYLLWRAGPGVEFSNIDTPIEQMG